MGFQTEAVVQIIESPERTLPEISGLIVRQRNYPGTISVLCL